MRRRRVVHKATSGRTRLPDKLEKVATFPIPESGMAGCGVELRVSITSITIIRLRSISAMNIYV